MIKQLRLITTVILAFMLIAAPAVTGAIYYVNGSGGSNGNNGQSWATSFATLQKALDVAAAGDTIWIAAGRYVPSEDRNGSTSSGRSRYRTFMLKDDVRVYGGFAGNELSGYDLSLRDFTANETILSGDINGNDGVTFSGNGENTYNVVCALAGVGSTTILDGVTVSGGNASGSGVPTGYGGGMSIEGGASPVLSNVIFRTNKAGLAGGGGINLNGSSATFINAQFIGNAGAMYTGGTTSLWITNSVFADNSGANVGGGIRAGGATIYLTNVTFYNNKANNQSGAMDLKSNCTVHIRNCIIYGNTAPSDPDMGGSAPTTIRNSLIGSDFYDGSGNASPMVAPLFVNAAGGDLRLQPGCPLRNMGDAVFFNAGQTPDLSAITTDIAGDPRIVGGQIDPGAYQSNYTGCSGVPPAGIITAGADSACVRETVTLTLSQNSYQLLGISYQWQKRTPSGSGVWTDIPLASDTLLQVSGQAVTTDYRCLVICSNSSDTAYSNVFKLSSYPCDLRWYVKETGGNDNNTGHQWTDAFATVQKALAASWPGDTVWVAGGRYIPSEDRSGSTSSGTSRYRTFMLKDSVQLYGGFAGNEPRGYDVSLRDFTANETILSGDINGNDGANFSGNGENTYNVVCALAGVGSTTILDGVTISGGNASGSGTPTGYGGGMSIEGGASPVLSNVIFRANKAGLAGGGGLNTTSQSEVTLINAQFIGNAGGIRAGGTLWITNSLFMDNSGVNVGGGIRVGSATTVICTNVTFYNNKASNNGGGIALNSGTAVADLRNCILYGNSAPTGPDLDGTATIRNSLVGSDFYDGSGNASPMVAPLFVNAAAGDLRLQSGCPLRNMGDTVFFNAGQTPDLSDITTDIAGDPRIVGGQIDPGAYQSNYPSCSGVPPAGIVTAVADSICVRETVTLTLSQNSYQLLGISYQWQKRAPSGSGVWTDIPLASDTLLQVSGQAVTTDYRCLVICSNSSDTAYSNVFKLSSYPCDLRWYVKETGGNDNNTGHQWTDAFATVQKALAASWPGDTVWVAGGRYVPSEDRSGSTSSGRSRYRTFMLKDSVQLYGGFAGNEPRGYDLSLRDFTTNETILSGDINGNDGANFSGNGENTYNVVCALAGVGSTTILDGVTISGGNASGSGTPTGYGGGMSIESGASPVLSNVIFRANKAGLAGGGGLNTTDQSEVTLINAQFIGNAGGIRAGGTLWITNSLFMDNSGVNVGGGIRVGSAATVICTNVTFYNNKANNNGGGIALNSATAVADLRNCILYGNSAPTGPDLDGTATIRNSLVGGDFYDGSGNASPMAAPLFVNAAGGDLRPQAGCPTRNMGDVVFFSPGQTPDLSAITTDIAGDPRIVGGQIDLGPYQSNYASCAGVPLAGVITAGADSVCVRETVTLALSQNSHQLSGISYEWQKRAPSGSGVWTTIPLASDTLLQVSGQAVTTDYRCLVICSNSSGTSYSNVFTVNSYPCDQRWYVKAANGNDNNTGHQWTDAFATVQKALAASWPGDTVWVAGGRYVPSEDRNGSTSSGRSRYRTFMLKDSVQLYGGFAGNEPRGYDVSLRDFTANETILSGDINGNDGANFSGIGENTYNVVCALAGVGSTTILDGVTVSGGNASGSGMPTGYGGGMSIEGGASPVLKNIVFRANKASLAGGGGINLDASSATIINAQFIGNAGAMYTGGATILWITNSVFADNSGANIGGGIRTGGATIYLTNVTFYNNKANDRSGAIEIKSNSTVHIRNCIIYGNTAPSDPDIGGTPATIRNSLIGSDFYDGSGNASPAAAPLFVNAAGGDLRLQPGCPLRNMGDAVFFNAGQTPDLSDITTDIAGDPRIVGGQIDPGAYQTAYPPLDAAVVAFIEPEDGDTICADGNFSLKVTVSNHGNQVLSNVPVTADYTTGTASAILTGPLPAGHTDTLLIPGVDMSAGGPRQIKVYSLLGGDANAGNDTIAAAVYVHVIAPVSLGNDTAFCAGNILVLDAGAGSGMTTAWSTGAATSVIDVDSSGTYSVVVTDFLGCTAGDTIQVVVHPLPQARIIPAGYMSLCDGDSITLDAGNAPGTICIWKKDGIAVDTGTNHTTAESGNYLVLVTDGNGCSDSSAITAIEVLPVPVVTVSPEAAGFCAGDHVLLQAACADTTDVIWQWRDGSGNIPNANASFYQVDIPGAYQVITIRSSAAVACSDTSDTAVITAFPPSVPMIYWDGITLRTDSSYASYQWYCNSQILPFANEPNYVPVQPGGFSVQATDTNGCVNTSASIYIGDPTQLDPTKIPEEAIRIYPNPAASVLIVESPVPIQITLGSMDGKAVLRTTPGHAGRTVIDVADLASGLYQVRITGSDGLLLRMEKLVKI